ncbi:ATP-binding protein [Leptolyngbya sp. FACHB-711]|uniref:ATP-binding protein n=1 Tax=unclassified Leptolyngbya TaxID=2650499 RepID=UPI0016867C2C|nr:ATP-binding protein [Leptolyngbya sp. FACHB-711]MBD1848448.1 response regulator [Cyanobacteria bacterium FACHB-502]MBD2024156.1 response regulator [Leptolyngbya sp. FACHB-711]
MNQSDHLSDHELERFFPGDSELAVRMRALDWSQTLLGPFSGWASSLKTAVSISLNSRFPMVIWWGKELVLIYNDAWRPILGTKHPNALGRPGQEVWSEIWDIIGVQLHSVLETAQATWSEDMLLLVDRYGFTEETYFTYSYSPIFLSTGEVGGAFTAVTETTRRVIGERQLRTLRELAANTVEAKSVGETCRIASATLANNPYDIPFALLYLVEQAGTEAHLVGTVRVDAETPASPKQVDLTQENDDWEFAKVRRTGTLEIIDDLMTRFGRLTGGAWDEPSRSAIVLPIVQAGQKQQLSGLLVLGVSPRRAFNDEYQGFFELVASNVATAIANAQAYEEERKRAEALAELDRAKTVFFSNVSHEFRTPLTLMLGPIEDALSDRDEPLLANQQTRIEMVQRNGLRLLKLVNTLLDFSRIESGRSQVVYEPTDLAEFTAELAGVFRSAIERANLRLVVNCSPLPKPVYVDRELWEKIVLNLLSNAFKFTFAGEISVYLEWQGNHVQLAVRDTGIGIPAGELPQLFERFHRVKGAQGRSFEGSGIGLSLVQELVRLHQGTIDVASVEGQGTCFTITIPTGTDHLPQDRINADRTSSSTALRANAYVEEALRWLPEAGNGKSEIGNREEILPTLTPDSPVPTPSAARILLADDNTDMRDYVKRLLSQQYEVEAVSDGAKALAAARQRVPDLVLTDVMMPQLDGFGLLQALRADPQTREVPIILLSARAGEEARVEGLAAGADDYLTKPFSARELIARVEASLKLAQLRREATQQEHLLRMEAETIRARLESVLAGINDQFIVLDREWRYTFVNEQVSAVTGKTQEELLGHCIWKLFPEVVNTPFDTAVHRAVTEQIFVRVELFYPPIQRWFENRIYPFAKGVTIFVSDISDRKQAEAEREQLLVREQAARQEAEQANRIKDEFLAVLSHELRSPLNPILGWSRLLQNGNLDEAKTKQAIATIERNAKLQAELIEDLLDVSRILQGKLALNVSPVDLAVIIKAALETVRLAAEAKSIQMKFSLSEVGQVSGDATRLQQVVWNLLSNAVKFTPAGGQVEVRLAQTDHQAQITVSDTGEGIPAEFLPYVFDYFRQADSTTTRRFGGLGLGLAIARHLVELHGGTVQAASRGEGMGATFTVKLPLPRTENQGLRTEGLAFNTQHSTLSPLEGVQVLVIDDEVDSCEFVAFVLEQAGASVTTAATASEGFLALTQSPPDILLSDIGMPDMDGYMLMRQIRRLPPEQGGQVKAIALTAYARDLDQQQALQAGFQQHLSKPVDPEVVIKTVVALVQKDDSEY